tara:strand:- start:142 stop:846 length:705 start_codon:yes stop_codon:yes gene_type:complete
LKLLKNKFEKFDKNWRRSLEGGLSSVKKRRSAMRHSFWIDHEFLRKFYHNDYEVVKGVYRANQPSPKRIENWYTRGIRTIINFRGVTNQGAYFLEEEACKNLSINLINFPLFATKLPSVDTVLELEKIFKSIKYPFLMHCKSGADRAGFGSVLYHIFMLNSSIEVAQKQLSFKYLHIGGWHAGILDFMFMRFRKDQEKNFICFKDWVKNEYDPYSFTKDYLIFRKTSPWLTIPR